MTTKLVSQINQWNDAYLLQQRFVKTNEYNNEALLIMDKEIAIRSIDPAVINSLRNDAAQDTADEDAPRLHPKEEFLPFNHLFSQIDLLLVRSMFQDAEIPFFVDNPPSESVLPIQSQSSRFLLIHVHRDHMEKATMLIDEHFIKGEGTYQLKYTDIKERLRSFIFNEINLAEEAMIESVEASLSTDEAAAVARYAQKLLDEIEHVESQRIVFFYDNLEELLSVLKKGENTLFNRGLLLCIMEVLQIYCVEPDFPESLNDVIQALLEMFAS